jgi:cytochrome P450
LIISRHDVYAHGQRNVRENQQLADDEDLRTAYLLFAVAAIIVIGITAAGAFIILIRNTQVRHELFGLPERLGDLAQSEIQMKR